MDAVQGHGQQPAQRRIEHLFPRLPGIAGQTEPHSDAGGEQKVIQVVQAHAQGHRRAPLCPSPTVKQAAHKVDRVFDDGKAKPYQCAVQDAIHHAVELLAI